MAIGPIGNAIFVNQMTANVSSIQNAHNNRIEFQNMVAQASMQEKDEKVLEVRPAEETHDIDPDREHEKNSSDQETARREHDDKADDDEEKSLPLYKLDIKV